MSDADELPEELGALIASERACPEPPSEVAARVFARLTGTLALPGEPASVRAPELGSPAPPTIHGGTGGTMARLATRVTRRGLATFLVGAAVGAGAVGTVDRVRSRTTVPAAVVKPAPAPAPAVEAHVPVPRPELAPEAAQPAAPPTVRRVAPVVADAKDSQLEAERKLIEMARTALARGQSEGALAALRRHQRWFPRGELAEERDSLLVSALIATGQHGPAREQAARFHRRYPHSLFAPVVDQAAGAIP